MADSSAQRTLVKSPPEVWAQVSDVGQLAQRLGEFGEIRITRVEAETTVAWEGDRACGTVELQPAGWGTRVTITAMAVEGSEPPAESAVIATLEEPPEVVAAPEATEEVQAPQGRGWLARLLRRRAAVAVTVEEPEADVEPVVEPVAVVVPEPAGPALRDEAIAAILSSALDDLGAAHHRPFSRG